MYILGTICCRGGSKGIPGKNTQLLSGKPLIAYTIDTALNCPLLNHVLISTDDDGIASVAVQYGGDVPFMRPAALATDSASKWPVFIHAVETFEQQMGVTVDYITDMDVTVPLKTPADVQGAIMLALSHPEADVVITGYQPERNPYFNMMETDSYGFASIVKKGNRPIVRRQDAPQVYSLTPAAYVIKKAALYQYAHWSEAKCMIYPIERERAIDIDTPLDLRYVEFLMQVHAGTLV